MAWLPGFRGVPHTVNGGIPQPAQRIRPHRCPFLSTSTTSPAFDAASSAVAISLFGCLLLLTMLPRYNGCWNLPTPSARPGRRCPGVVVPGTRRGSRMGNQRASSAGSRSVLVQPRCPVPSPPSRPVTAPSGRPSPPRPHPPGETSDGRATCPISFLSSLDELRCPHPWSGSGIRLLSWFRAFASSSWTAGKPSLPGTWCGA